MEPEPKYQLVILFDQTQTDISQLWTLAHKLLGDDVTKRVGLSEDGDLTLIIEGTLEAVDRDHVQISKYLTERKQWNKFRLKDAAGDEIRRRAYPMLSMIEQELRSFVNRCLIDALGFGWWASLGEIKIPGIDDPYHRRMYHPLELMTIEQLIGFVTFEKAEWEEDNPVSFKDLLSVLDKSHDFEEFRANLERKARKISLWDDVFSKYFGLDERTGRRSEGRTWAL